MLSTKQETKDSQLSTFESSNNISKQLLDIEILYLLTFAAKSGYELRKQLLNWFKINISYGTLYPHLHSLEKSGLVSGSWHQKFEDAAMKKRLYSLTPVGHEVLRGNIETLCKIGLTMQFMVTKVNVNPQQLQVVSDESRRALDMVESFLSRRGFSVKKPAVVKGFSGQEYAIELYASRPGFRSSNLVVKLSERASDRVSIEDILKMHVMSFDLGGATSIILSCSPLTEELKKLAEFYHVSVYTGQDSESAAMNMSASYNENTAF